MKVAQARTTQNGTPESAGTAPPAMSASRMMPIDFCASLVPCASETSDADPIWPQRKPRLVVSCGRSLVMRATRKVPSAATPIAITGASSAGIITLDRTPVHRTPFVPTAARTEPTTPPMRACEELDGIPSNQVSRFQVIPPTRPASTTSRVMMFASTIPLAMVAATARDRNAPTRLRTADSATAVLGLRARVAMDVAIALPVSWKPFVKSKARAVTTTSASRIVSVTYSMVNGARRGNEPSRRVFDDCSPGVHLAFEGPSKRVCGGCAERAGWAVPARHPDTAQPILLTPHAPPGPRGSAGSP
ncbi:hypothetical protein D3C74_291810 [compost metagenome]